MTSRKLLGLLTIVLVAGCAAQRPQPYLYATMPVADPKYLVDTSGVHAMDDALAIISGDGIAPVAWGRYIINRGSPDPFASARRDLALSELPWLRRRQISIVPIVTPRQFTLAGTEADARALAAASAEIVQGIVRGFPTAESPMGIAIYLDVEGDSYLSADYLRGWCDELSRRTLDNGRALLPAIYTNAAAKRVRQLLIDGESNCHIASLWLANYRGPIRNLEWQDMRTDLDERLPRLPDSLPIYLWQYFGGEDVDYTLVNPQFVDAMLATSITISPP